MPRAKSDRQDERGVEVELNQLHLETFLSKTAKRSVAWVQSRVDQIEAELRSMPRWQRRNARHHELKEERRALLWRLDVITRPKEKWACDSEPPRTRSSMVERRRGVECRCFYQDAAGRPAEDPFVADGTIARSRDWEPPLWGQPTTADQQATGATLAILGNGALATSRAEAYKVGAATAGIPWPDLTQAAQLGLAEAVATHDPAKGPLGAWASLHIKSAICREITHWVKRPRTADTRGWQLTTDDKRLLDSPDRRRQADRQYVERMVAAAERLMEGLLPPLDAEADLGDHEAPVAKDPSQPVLAEQHSPYDLDHPILGKENRQMRAALRQVFGCPTRPEASWAGMVDPRDPEAKAPKPQREHLDPERHAEYRADRAEVALERIGRTDPAHTSAVRLRCGLGAGDSLTLEETADRTGLSRRTVKRMIDATLVLLRDSVLADETRAENV